MTSPFTDRLDDEKGTGTPRAILDTNVFVAAGFRPSSAAARLVAAARAGRLIVVWNPATRAETVAVLERIPRLSAGGIEDVMTNEGAFDGPADPALADFVTDPADRKFAALAIVTGATLVTNDGDLLEHADRGYRVTRPGAFLRSHAWLVRAPDPD